MIRSSKFTLKYNNVAKNQLLKQLFADFKVALQECVDLIVTKELPLKSHLSSKCIPDFTTIQQANWKVIVYDNAAAIVKGNLVKCRRKTFKRYQKLFTRCMKENKHHKFTSKKYGDLNINYLKRIKNMININNVCFDVNYMGDNKIVEGYFNEFVRIRLPYFQPNRKRTMTINLPIKWHKHSLKFKQWKEKKTFKLQQLSGQMYLIKVYKKEQAVKKPINKRIGIDMGYKKLISTSTGNFYGSELESIYKRISAKKQGSKAFKRLLKHRDNLTNQFTSQFVVNERPDQLIIEDLYNVKHKSKLPHQVNNRIQRWVYTKIKDKLRRLSEEEGFQLDLVEPAYTSQKCSKCGFVHPDNRSGEKFRCTSCNMEMDADSNAAINILHAGVYNPCTTQELDF